MNGVHDMGGMHGFGSVATDDDSPFHHDWEVPFHALMRVIGSHGVYTGDEHRNLRERLPPDEYLRAGYYEQRLLPIEWLLVQAGILEAGEVDARIDRARDAGEERIQIPERLDPDLVEQVRASIASNSSFEHGSENPAFEPGDRVVVKNMNPDGHTRCPRYVRRAEGVVEKFHGCQRYPDESIEGDTVGKPLYSVRFTAQEVWGEDHSEADSLVLQLWEPYLRSAE